MLPEKSDNLLKVAGPGTGKSDLSVLSVNTESVIPIPPLK